jgi:hypothetical protein
MGGALPHWHVTDRGKAAMVERGWDGNIKCEGSGLPGKCARSYFFLQTAHGKSSALQADGRTIGFT